MRCLEKDRADRVQDISTARFVLTEQANLATLQAAAAPPRRSARSWWIAAAALAGIAAGVTAVAWAWPAIRGSGRVPRTARFQLAPGLTPLVLQNSAVAAGQFGTLVAVSPDGSRIVYSGVRDGVPVLMTRPLDPRGFAHRRYGRRARPVLLTRRSAGWIHHGGPAEADSD
jgi:hypothetical protein